MQKINYTESREARFAEAITRVSTDHEPVVIEQGGKPPVVLLSLEDYEALRRRADHAHHLDRRSC